MADRAVRRVAVALALALAAGGLLSVTDGLARVLGAVSGYADFGYMPSKCGGSTRTTQTIDGGTVRVCQTDYSTTYAFFSGHRGFPLWNSEVEMTLQLPDKNLSYYCCGGNHPTYPGFEPATLGPVTVGNPLTGTSSTSAGGYAAITKTASVIPGASSYTLTYTVTNTSGAPLRMRPMVAVNGYGDTPAARSTSAPPRTIVLRDAQFGGALSLAESSANGGEPIAGYSAGYLNAIAALAAPNAPALDNNVHPEQSAGAPDAAALAWADTSVNAGGVRKFSVTVSLVQTREVLLELRGAAPAAGAPLTIDASVSDDRPLAGGVLRWAAKSGNETAAALDGSGRASFTLPGAQGFRWVYAYFDANRNSRFDDDEPSAYGRIWAPAAPAATPTPPGPAPVIPISVPAIPSAPPRGAPVPVTALKLPFKKTFRVKRCRGTVTLQLKLGKKVLAKRTAKLNKRCQLSTTFTVNPAVIGKGKTLTVVVKQGHKQKSFSLKVPGVM